MAHLTSRTQPSKTQQLIKGDRRMFSASDDNIMIKQVLATHSPDGREVDVKPILYLIEDILRQGGANIGHIVNGTNGHVETLEDKTSMAAFDGMLEALAFVVQKISCEISCKCTGGGDAHATTMALFNTLSNYSWEAKVVLTLAAFAILYGEFLLVAQLFATNSLAKSVALLKQLPSILEHSNFLKPQFDALKKLTTAVINVTKCIIKFTELPPQYISLETPVMESAMALIPTATYWTIRSVVACASRIMNLIGPSQEHFASTTEAWELSSLAHKVSTIHEHHLRQIKLCQQHIDEKIQTENYNNLVRLFETLHLDNIKVIKALIPSKDGQPPLFHSRTKNRVNLDILREKHVLLLISDFDLSHEEIQILSQKYTESRARHEFHYEVVWLPIVDRSMSSQEEHLSKFNELQEMMPWFSVYDPLLIEPEVIKYTKEVWHFTKKPITVSLDGRGRVTCKNAHHMIWIWGNQAFPFTDEKEESLWSAETWKLELLVDNIDPTLFDWMNKDRIICLYGGVDTAWIREFTSAVKKVAEKANIALEMVYVGKSNAKERVRRINRLIAQENLSHYWPDISVWYFWARLECMLYSKLQHVKTPELEHIKQEVMTILSFDGSDQGWALFYKGWLVEMARAKGESALTSIVDFDKWKDEADKQGFVPALQEYLQGLKTPHHCNRLIFPGINGEISEKVVCAECGRPMEKYFMYRCCDD